MRMADPSPFGETSFRAIVRAICAADPAKVRGGGCVESVLTLLTQRRCEPFLAMASTLFTAFTRDTTEEQLVYGMGAQLEDAGYRRQLLTYRY